MSVRYRYIQPTFSRIDGRLRMPGVEVDPDNFAHGVWTALAITLAEPLRKAFHEHVTEHGCDRHGGTAYCDEASALLDLLPTGDTIAC